MDDDLRALQLIHEQARHRHHEALAEQLRLEAALGAALTQAEQLVAYRGEYERRWQAEFRRAGDIERVRGYHAFMDRLSQAIVQQQRVATQQADQAQRAAALSRELDMRASALGKLIERRQREGVFVAARIEQRLADDRAARAPGLHHATVSPRLS